MQRRSSSAGPADVALQLSELRALREIAALVAERHEVPRLLHLILVHAAALVEVDDGYLYLIEPDRETLSLAAGVGAFSDREGLRIRAGDPFWEGSPRVERRSRSPAIRPRWITVRRLPPLAAAAAPLRGRESTRV